MPTFTTPVPMVAHGPLTTPDGELLWQVRESPASTPAPRRTITVRCLDRDGNDLADPVILTGPLGAEALAQIVGDRPSGSLDAERLDRRAFRAMVEWQDAPGRGVLVYRRLRALSRLAMAAVTREIPADVTWETATTETEGDA